MKKGTEQEAKTPWYGIPWLVIPFYVLLVMVSVPFALRVQKDFSTQRFVPDDEPDLLYNREIVEEFGGDELIVIGIEADDVFSPEILQAVEDLTAVMESGPGVTRVVSLSTVNKLEGEAGFLDSDLLMPYVPTEAEEIAALRAIALNDRILTGEVVAGDGTATAVNVFVNPDLIESDYLGTITAYVDAAITEVRNNLPADVEIYAVGTPQMMGAFRVSMERDLQRLVPIAVVLIAGVLLVVFRSFVFALIPILTGCTSIIPTIAFMSLTGFRMDPITSIVPFLILVLGSTEDTHLLTEYRRYRRSGCSINEAIQHMFDHAGTAILLTSFTTALGFASLTISEIPALRDFGIVAGFGIILNFLITVHLLPALLRAIPSGVFVSAGEGSRSPRENKFSRYAQQVTVRHRVMVILLGAAAILFLLAGTQRLHTNTDFIRILHQDNPVRVGFERLQTAISGVNFLRVVVEAPGPDDMLRVEYLENLDKVDRYLQGRFDKTLSLAQFIRKIHVEMNNGDPRFDVIPEDEDLIAQYVLLLNQEDLSRVIDFDHRRATIIVRAKSGSSLFLGAEEEALKDFVASEVSPAIKVRMTGRLLQMVHSANIISEGIQINIAIMLTVIVATISLLFFSLKAGLLSLVPNLFPILAVFGMMGWTGLPFSIFTFSVAVIGLGIAVDDTIHFLSRYHQQLRLSDTPEKAMRQTIAHEFLPIASTSIALSGGFLILTTSNFATTAEFGFLSAISISTAFLGDLFFAPSLLLRTPIVSSWAFVRMKLDVERLMGKGLFHEMGKNDIKRIAVMGQIFDYPDGDTVLRKGDSGQDIFLILNGRADVFLDSRSLVEPVASYQAGDVIGEMAFLRNTPRSADVVARGSLKLLKIDDSTLNRITVNFPRTATKIYRNLAHMLVGRLKQRTEWGISRHPLQEANDKDLSGEGSADGK